jgi:Concanavalin A-like lectin/glucanases superfamily
MRKILIVALSLLLTPMTVNAGRGFAGIDLIVANGIGTALDIPTGPLTISVWFYATAIDGSEHDLFSHWQGTAGSQWIIGIGAPCSGCGATTLNYSIGCCSAISGDYGSCGIPSSNAWHNIVVTTDASTGYDAYLDGVGCGGAAYHEHRTAGGANVNIGGYNGTANFKGRLAEIGVWTAALNIHEISVLAKGTSPNNIRRSSLAGYWPLYGAGSPEPDYSGSVNNGTLTGTTVVPHCPCGFPTGN